MTKQQIKTALELCASADRCCGECPYFTDSLCTTHMKVDAARAIEPDCAVFDKVEEYENCTVQVLVNTKTGAVSVGWKRNEQ